MLILTHSIVLYILFTLGGVVHCTVFVDLSQTYHPPPTLIKNSAFNISTWGGDNISFKILFQNPQTTMSRRKVTMSMREIENNKLGLSCSKLMSSWG